MSTFHRFDPKLKSRRTVDLDKSNNDNEDISD